MKSWHLLKQKMNSEATCYKMQDMYLMKGGNILY